MARRSAGDKSGLPSRARGALLVALTLLCFAHSRAGHAAAQGPTARCTMDTRTELSQPMLLLGDAVTVTHQTSLRCPEEDRRRHIVFVIDAAALAGDASREIPDAIRELVLSLGLGGQPRTKVGIVSFDSAAQTLCPLTGDAALISHCLEQLRPSYGSMLARGILAGIEVLQAPRDPLPNPAALSETLILISARKDQHPPGCAEAPEMAASAAHAHILVAAIGLGDAHDPMCLRSVASAPRFFWQVSDAASLGTVLDTIGQQTGHLFLRQSTIVVTIPDNMELVEGSSDPAMLGPRRELVWPVIGSQLAANRISYVLRPTEAGTHATNRGASIAYYDRAYDMGQAAIPEGRVTVLAPRVLPTP